MVTCTRRGQGTHNHLSEYFSNYIQFCHRTLTLAILGVHFKFYSIFKFFNLNVLKRGCWQFLDHLWQFMMVRMVKSAREAISNIHGTFHIKIHQTVFVLRHSVTVYLKSIVKSPFTTINDCLISVYRWEDKSTKIHNSSLIYIYIDRSRFFYECIKTCLRINFLKRSKKLRQN